MTIAACYLSFEGVVLGADSTSTMFVAGQGHQQGSEHHYNFAQKVFEFGERGATLAIAVWGMGSFPDASWRTLVAETADEAHRRRTSDFAGLSALAAETFWKRYTSSCGEFVERIRSLEEKGSQRSPEENNELLFWKNRFSGGFCLGGRWGSERRPRAVEYIFDPLLESGPKITELACGRAYFWGCPNLIERINYGIDSSLVARVIESGKWQGSVEELVALVSESALGQPLDLPMREAIDYVYAVIYITIKAMKFSHLAPICGGPIEVAVVTSDRPFRWVCHKSLRHAIDDCQTGDSSHDW